MGVSSIEGDAELDVLFNASEWGNTATYTPPSGSASTVQIVLELGVKVIDGETGEVLGVAHTATFRLDQVSDPARDGTILVGSTTYVIQDVIERDENTCKVQVRKQ